MDDSQQFFKLLDSSNKCTKNNKFFEKEDPQGSNTFLKFLVRIENNIHYSQKQEYLELAKDFLADKISAEDFSYSFMAIYQGVNQKLDQMKKDSSLELADFLKSNRPELGRLLAGIYGSCDSYNPNPKVEIASSDEKELKEFAESLLFKLQEESN